MIKLGLLTMFFFEIQVDFEIFDFNCLKSDYTKENSKFIIIF